MHAPSTLGLAAEHLQRMVPTVSQVAVWLPTGAVLSCASLWLCGSLKLKARWKTPYTRKLNHLLVFACAAIVSLLGGSAAVCAFGLGVVLPILVAVHRGSGFLMFEAMARERDEPHRSYYILLPLAATAVGGLVSNVLWGAHAALLGYLVAGVADAVAEPVGTRFGRRWYRVPSRAGSGTRRSMEGSAAVFVASVVLLLLYWACSPGAAGASVALVPLIGGLAALYALTEALSPHGLDNAFLQVVPAWSAGLLIA